MPNWCENSLVVSPTEKNKESSKQLRKFVNDINNKGKIISIKEAIEMRTKFLEENFERYRDAADVFIIHSEMPIEKFMEDIMNYKHDKSKKQFNSDKSFFCMNNLLPVPMDLMHPDLENYGGKNEKEKMTRREEMKKKYGFESWYDWRCANWGTKWDISDSCTIDDSKDSVQYRFDTAWSPITNFLENIGEKYPLLTFELHYEEGGNGFAGDFTVEGGEVIRNDEYDFGYDDEENEDL